MSEQSPTTVEELIRWIDAAWNRYQAYIDTLNKDQLTQPTDAAGWTAKDHLIHVAVWEDTLNALLEQIPRWERLEIDQALWDSEDVDRINAVIQKRHQNMPLDEVRERHREVHNRLMSKIARLSDQDLQRPICDYQPGTTDAHPILNTLIADTYESYGEHTPWIAAIVAEV